MAELIEFPGMQEDEVWVKRPHGDCLGCQICIEQLIELNTGTAVRLNGRGELEEVDPE